MSTAAIAMGQETPSLDPATLESTAADAHISPAALQDNVMVKTLIAKLSEQYDLVIDFSSLKTCLNPLGIEDTHSQEQVHIDMIRGWMHQNDFHLLQDFDYEELVRDLIEKQTEKLPNLKKLTVRRLLRSSKPLKDEQFDRCKSRPAAINIKC